MKRAVLIKALLMVLAVWGVVMLSTPAYTQLILTNQRMKIVKVEQEFNRLQCRVHEENKGNVQYILIDGNTKFSTNNREVSYNEAWNHFRKDMIIRVQGGFTITGRIKAKTIYW